MVEYDMDQEMTSLNIFSLNFFGLSFDTKNIPFHMSMDGEPKPRKFAIYFNHFVLQEESVTENIFVDVSSSQSKQKYYHIWSAKWCKC